MVTRTPAMVGALCELAADNPAMFATLEKLTKLGPYSVLIGSGVSIGMAAATDLGKVKPYAPMAMGLGVTEAWCEANKPEDVERMLAEMKEKAPGMFDQLMRKAREVA